MARRATLIKSARAAHGDSLLVLDAGNTLFGRPLSLRSQGRVLVEAMNAMGYDAMVASYSELGYGLEVFLARQADAAFPFLSANLVDSEREPIATPYITLDRAGGRIGIIGLSEPNPIQLSDSNNTLTPLDPIEAARQYVVELRPQVDVLIVLSHLGLDLDANLAREVPGIDIIVGGRSRKLMQVPERVGDTFIVQQGYQGQWVGRLTVAFDEQWQVVNVTEELITLGQDFADDREMAALMVEWATRYPAPPPSLPIEN